jgi:hypothetical protein
VKFTGEIQSVTKDWKSKKFIVSFLMNEALPTDEVNSLMGEKLNIEAKKWRKPRSTDANALLWHCLGEIASVLRADKWDIYLEMLKRYGKYTYICIKPNMVDAMKLQWRECEVVGEIDINGTKAIQMLCYFGSSTLDTKEFSVLLDGVISEMKEMGLQTPTSQDMKRVLEQWEKQHG